MIKTARDKIAAFRTRWKILILLEAILFATGSAFLCFAAGFQWYWALLIFILIFTGYILYKKPWKISFVYISGFLDRRLSKLQYSTGLLLVGEQDLTPLSRLQKHKTENEIISSISKVKPENNLIKSLVFLSICIVLGFFLSRFNFINPTQNNNIPGKESINFIPIDSLENNLKPPKLIDQSLRINYPGYTNLASAGTTNMNFKALAGSRITWNLKFDVHVEKVILESDDKTYKMKLADESYTTSINLRRSAFYNFRFLDSLGNSYVSEVYFMERTEDEAPQINIENVPQFSSFDHSDNKVLKFRTNITDDYGLKEAYIIATVSKGSGEAVKFREERLAFDKKVPPGQKSFNINSSINLADLKMQPGDELYFYVEAADLKSPSPNMARSETYFAAIRDTITSEFATEGSMGVDLMPDYFRSQRQLIIDTEKLIEEKDEISVKEFNSRSNALGFDQKALRIKYGQFMGDESESGIAAQSHSENSEHTEENENSEDPLAEYSHNHDSENEGALATSTAEASHKDEDHQDPLEEYLHNHDDPEKSTLFTNSLKGKLKEAMNQMWDAELYLRLYEPEKSLPYQYISLKLLQEIKNSARIYVHRIGFDPPPIKEDKRLSGELEEIKSFRESEERKDEDRFEAIRNTVDRLEEVIQSNGIINESNRILIKEATQELSELAVKNPKKYLETLSNLKLLYEGKNYSREELKKIQAQLVSVIPKDTYKPGKEKTFQGELNELVLKELNSDD